MVAAFASSSTIASRATTSGDADRMSSSTNVTRAACRPRNGPGRPGRSGLSLVGVANKVTKTEHAGAKNGGGGYWGLRAEAKHWSNRARRSADRKKCDLRPAEELPDLDEAEDW